jgi:hypothetical protein
MGAAKKPLIKLSYRPPDYETPVSYFETAITPNDASFVRYHLAVIPEIDAREWRLRVGGEAAASPFELTLAELQTGFEQVEVTAVCHRNPISVPTTQCDPISTQAPGRRRLASGPSGPLWGSSGRRPSGRSAAKVRPQRSPRPKSPLTRSRQN